MTLAAYHALIVLYPDTYTVWNELAFLLARVGKLPQLEVKEYCFVRRPAKPFEGRKPKPCVVKTCPGWVHMFLPCVGVDVVISGTVGPNKVIFTNVHYFEVVGRVVVVALDDVADVNSGIQGACHPQPYPQGHVYLVAGWLMVDEKRMGRLYGETCYLLFAEVVEWCAVVTPVTGYRAEFVQPASR